MKKATDPGSTSGWFCLANGMHRSAGTNHEGLNAAAAAAAAAGPPPPGTPAAW